jgi:hypothetical protein
MTRTITIYCISGSDYTVQEGEALCDRLCWDEMLGTIAELTHPAIGKARYRMETAEQREAREQAFKARMAEHPNAAKIVDSTALDALRQWQASELLDDPQEHANARAERDRIIAAANGGSPL